MTAVATYVGGPLEGRPVQRVRTQWPLYRDDDGKPITAKKGDAEWVRKRRQGKGEASRYYILQRRNCGYFYVHATAWIDFDRREQ